MGQSLVRRLLREGHYVKVLDLKCGRLRRTASPNLRLVLGSMTDPLTVRQVMKGTDVVYHLALAGGFSIKSLEPVSANLQGALNLLRSAKSCLLYTSDAADE